LKEFEINTRYNWYKNQIAKSNIKKWTRSMIVADYKNDMLSKKQFIELTLLLNGVTK
jgi:hypothetical protein